MFHRSLNCLIFSTVLLLIQQPLLAQELSARADRKITGQYYLPHSASAYQRAAMEHAKVLNYYGQNYSTVPKEVAQRHLAEIQRNVGASKKELAKLKPEAAKDKELREPLAAIERHLAACAEACEMLTDESGDDTSDGAAVCECCDRMERELAAAEAETDKIKKQLGVDQTAKPKKTGKPKK